MATTIVVRQFRPAWDLLAYLAFSNAPHDVENASYSHSASTGPLPQVRVAGGNELVPAHEALSWVIKKVGDLDASIARDDQAKALSLALRGLIDGVLADALDFMRWSDEEHWNAVVKPAMAASMPFPLNFILPRVQRKRKMLEFAAKGFSVSRFESKVKDAYACLAAQIRGKKWLLGTSQPTTADACLFGHLAHAICEPIAKYIPPELLKYHRNVHESHFVSSTSNQVRTKNRSNCFAELSKLQINAASRPLPVPASMNRADVDEAKKKKRAKEELLQKPTKEEKDFERGTRNAVAAALCITVAYIAINIPVIRIQAAN